MAEIIIMWEGVEEWEETRERFVTFHIEEWEETRERVNELLEKYTGTNEYPMTKSIPPIIIGVQGISEEGINALKELDGVRVRRPDDNDD